LADLNFASATAAEFFFINESVACRRAHVRHT
jgi:hypothetical protein